MNLNLPLLTKKDTVINRDEEIFADDSKYFEGIYRKNDQNSNKPRRNVINVLHFDCYVICIIDSEYMTVLNHVSNKHSNMIMLHRS